MDLSIQQLRMLRAVAGTGTIAAAAESLGYTPSAVSQQLGAIEKSTGVAVLERVGRNVQLTDAGRELVLHAGIVLAQLEVARASLERVQTEVAGTVRVGLIESVAATLLPDVLRRLRADHPRLEVRTVQGESVDAVRSGELDVSFLIDDPRQRVDAGPTITRSLVCRDWYRAVVPDGWAGPAGWADSASISLAQLVEFPLVASPPHLSCGRCVKFAFAAEGLTADIVHQIDDYPTILHLVAAGAGVGIVPDLGLWRVPPGLRVLALDPPTHRTVDLAYRSSSAHRPAIGAFVAAVNDAATGLGLDRDAAPGGSRLHGGRSTEHGTAFRP